MKKEKVINAYVETLERMKKLMDEVGNTKVKLNYDTSDDHPITVIVCGSLKKSPFYHPSIDDIVDEIMDYVRIETAYPTKRLNPIYLHITPNDVYEIILAYFPSNPILINHVSGVIKSGTKYHTCHWRDTVEKLMNYKGISDVTKARLIECISESGKIKVDTDAMLECYFGEYNNVVKFIHEINKI